MTWIIQKHNVISVVIALLLADSPSPYKTTRLVSHCAHQQSRNVHSVWLGRDVAMKYFPVCGYRLLLLLLVRRSLNWARRSKSLPDLIWHRRGTTSPVSLSEPHLLSGFPSLFCRTGTLMRKLRLSKWHRFVSFFSVLPPWSGVPKLLRDVFEVNQWEF